MPETDGTQHAAHLGVGIVAGGVDVGRCQSAGFHHSVGTAVHGLAVLGCPSSALVERAGAGFVDKVVVEQFYRRQCHADAVARWFYPSGFGMVHVYSEPHGAVVYSYQTVVAEETAACGVHHFLVGNGQEFPFADGLYRLYLFRSDVYPVVGGNRNLVVLRHPDQPEYHDSHYYYGHGNGRGS